jgi:hypothetical protein
MLSQLDVTLLYIIFRCFKKYQILPKNTKKLAFGYTKNVCLGHKNGSKSVFLGHEAHILARLDVTASCINF